ncbi:hypothetical protein VB10N_46390 [Vibrio sp. 10N]|nr:hypothetical protein VB10N_46390 [Vibrio sp. 10N]
MSNTQVAATEKVANLPAAKPKVSLITKFAERFNVDGGKLMATLKSTAFKQRNGQPPTDEQMMALLIVADQYQLNPFTKEIYAFPDQNNGIIPIVGIDGWSTIMNNHPQFDGIEYRFADTTVELKGLNKPIFEWIECVVYRKDRERPTIVREYLDEIYRAPFEKNGRVINGPWQTHTRRFARHKVTIQTLRLALGYTGLFDEDEANRIIDAEAKVISSQPAIELDADFDSDDSPSSTSPVQIEQGGIDDAEFFEATAQAEPEVEYFNTSFGQVLKKDAKMIAQMVEFTKEGGSWDTTKDSFEERYSEATLDFALSELKVAFNETFDEE